MVFMSEEHQLSDFVAGLTTAPGGGEANTASNTGTAGIGVFKQKVGVNLEYKKLNPASAMVSIIDDTANSKIDINIVPANITGLPQSSVTNLVSDLAAKQTSDADLTAIAGLNSASAGVIASDGAGWIHKTYAQLKTALGLVKADVGLGNVDNTSDATKNAAAATLTNKTISGANNTISGLGTSSLTDDAVTYAQIQNVSTASRLLGRGAGLGAGDVQEIVLGTNLSMTGTTLNGASASASMIHNVHANAAAQFSLTNQPNTLQFLANSSRHVMRFDLTNFTQVRIMVFVVTASASVNDPRLIVKYRTTFDANPVNWLDLDTSGEVAAGLNVADTVATSGWGAMPAGAKADVLIAVTQHGGDGVADPAIGSVAIQFR